MLGQELLTDGLAVDCKDSGFTGFRSHTIPLLLPAPSPPFIPCSGPKTPPPDPHLLGQDSLKAGVGVLRKEAAPQLIVNCSRAFNEGHWSHCVHCCSPLCKHKRWGRGQNVLDTGHRAPGPPSSPVPPVLLRLPLNSHTCAPRMSPRGSVSGRGPARWPGRSREPSPMPTGQTPQGCELSRSR